MNGFILLPSWHPVENHFEGPLFYYDELSTFFVKPDERTIRGLPEFEAYYPVYEIPVKYIEIPELVREPVKGWPPDELIDVGEDITNPWEWNNEAIRTNVNYTTMLPTNDTFVFGDTVFDTGGRVSERGF